MSHLRKEKKMNKSKLKKILNKIKHIKNYDSWYRAYMIEIIKEVN